MEERKSIPSLSPSKQNSSGQQSSVEEDIQAVQQVKYTKLQMKLQAIQDQQKQMSKGGVNPDQAETGQDQTQSKESLEPFQPQLDEELFEGNPEDRDLQFDSKLEFSAQTSPKNQAIRDEPELIDTEQPHEENKGNQYELYNITEEEYSPGPSSNSKGVWMEFGSSMGAHTPIGMGPIQGFFTGFGSSGSGFRQANGPNGQVLSARSRLTTRGPHIGSLFFEHPLSDSQREQPEFYLSHQIKRKASLFERPASTGQNQAHQDIFYQNSMLQQLASRKGSRKTTGDQANFKPSESMIAQELQAYEQFLRQNSFPNSDPSQPSNQATKSSKFNSNPYQLLMDDQNRQSMLIQESQLDQGTFDPQKVKQMLQSQTKGQPLLEEQDFKSTPKQKLWGSNRISNPSATRLSPNAFANGSFDNLNAQNGSDTLFFTAGRPRQGRDSTGSMQEFLKEHQKFMNQQEGFALSSSKIYQNQSARALQQNRRSTHTDSSKKGRGNLLGETGKASRDDQSDDDLLSHMSRLSQLLPAFENFDISESQRGSLRSIRPLGGHNQMIKQMQQMQIKMQHMQAELIKKENQVRKLQGKDVAEDKQNVGDFYGQTNQYVASQDVIDEENEGAESEIRHGSRVVKETDEEEPNLPRKQHTLNIPKHVFSHEEEILEIKKELSNSVLSRSPSKNKIPPKLSSKNESIEILQDSDEQDSQQKNQKSQEVTQRIENSSSNEERLISLENQRKTKQRQPDGRNTGLFSVNAKKYQETGQDPHTKSNLSLPKLFDLDSSIGKKSKPQSNMVSPDPIGVIEQEEDQLAIHPQVSKKSSEIPSSIRTGGIVQTNSVFSGATKQVPMPNKILYQESSQSNLSPPRGHQISFNQASDPQPHRLVMINSLNSSNQDYKPRQISPQSRNNAFVTEQSQEQVTLRVNKNLQEESDRRLRGIQGTPDLENKHHATTAPASKQNTMTKRQIGSHLLASADPVRGKSRVTSQNNRKQHPLGNQTRDKLNHSGLLMQRKQNRKQMRESMISKTSDGQSSNQNRNMKSPFHQSENSQNIVALPLSEQISHFKKKNLELRKELVKHTDENLTQLDKIDNFKQLYNQKMDALEQLQSTLDDKIVECEVLKNRCDHKQASIECHLNEIEELKKKLSKQNGLEKMDIRNKETQINYRDFTKDAGSQVGLTLQMLEQKIQSQQQQFPPLIINPYAIPYMQIPFQIEMPQPKDLTGLLQSQSINRTAKIQKDFNEMSVKIDKMISKDFDLIEENIKNEQMRLALKNQTMLKQVLLTDKQITRLDHLYEEYTEDLTASGDESSDDVSDLDALSPDTRQAKIEKLYQKVQKYDKQHKNLEKQISLEDEALQKACQSQPSEGQGNYLFKDLQPLLAQSQSTLGYSNPQAAFNGPFGTQNITQLLYQKEEKLKLFEDKILLLEKTNIALNQKLLSFKDKYSQMKNKFKGQIHERDITIQKLTGKYNDLKKYSPGSRGRQMSRRSKSPPRKYSSPKNKTLKYMGQTLEGFQQNEQSALYRLIEEAVRNKLQDLKSNSISNHKQTSETQVINSNRVLSNYQDYNIQTQPLKVYSNQQLLSNYGSFDQRQSPSVQKFDPLGPQEYVQDNQDQENWQPNQQEDEQKINRILQSEVTFLETQNRIKSAVQQENNEQEPSHSSPIAEYTKPFQYASITTQKKWIDNCTDEIVGGLPLKIQTSKKIKENVRQVIVETVSKLQGLGSSQGGLSEEVPAIDPNSLGFLSGSQSGFSPKLKSIKKKKASFKKIAKPKPRSSSQKPRSNSQKKVAMSINFQNSMFDQNPKLKTFDYRKNTCIPLKARSFSRKSMKKYGVFKSRLEQQVIKEKSQSWFIPVPKPKRKSKSGSRKTKTLNQDLQVSFKRHNFTLGQEQAQEPTTNLQINQQTFNSQNQNLISPQSTHSDQIAIVPNEEQDFSVKLREQQHTETAVISQVSPHESQVKFLQPYPQQCLTIQTSEEMPLQLLIQGPSTIDSASLDKQFQEQQQVFENQAIFHQDQNKAESPSIESVNSSISSQAKPLPQNKDLKQQIIDRVKQREQQTQLQKPIQYDSSRLQEIKRKYSTKQQS